MNATQIGLIGAFLTTVAAFPQVARAWRTRRVRDISVWQPVLLAVGMIFWLIYGLLLRDLPLIAANMVSLVCNLLLIGMKLVFSRNDEEDPAEPATD